MQSAPEKLSKKPEPLKKAINWLNSPYIIIVVGLLIFFFGAFHYYQIRALSFTKIPSQITSPDRGELPVSITIPSIGIDLPVGVGSINDGVWQISYSSPTFLDSSSRPGTGGNVVIYGHNKKAIFGNLPYLSIGQKIFVKTQDGQIHPYIASEKFFVGADRVDLVSPSPKEELTIFTCWGLFDNQRVVVKATPI